MPVFSTAQVARLADACIGIAQQSSDVDGFVSVRALLHRFEAEVILRPLLVEAMLCETVNDPSDGANQTERWRLLVDSDQYRLSEEAVKAETPAAPLPHRFRNTVAHELAHSLAFRSEEFSVRLATGKKGLAAIAAIDVEEIERHTEALSPLLLVPERAIERFFPASLSRLDVTHLAAARRSLGVSRFVMINRINLLRTYGNPLFAERDCMQNTAIGIGRWSRDGQALLSGWPLYGRFDGSNHPAFLYELRRHRALLAADLISDPAFVLNGGSDSAIRMHVPSGTMKNPRSGLLSVEFSIEPTRKKPNATFFFVVKVSP